MGFHVALPNDGSPEQIADLVRVDWDTIELSSAGKPYVFGRLQEKFSQKAKVPT